MAMTAASTAACTEITARVLMAEWVAGAGMASGIIRFGLKLRKGEVKVNCVWRALVSAGGYG
ncbi:hypothetical protein NSE01_03050 [Novosphingobium sediminis]|uniref:Uncharacterized protein n=1 Tax=Novosphingobium sediminis TaxID=707214 RepID=A0A512AFQ0_9SPHN|nr:hypothetical protein NSE01_03050 [Novosphingobium sediminis]